MTREEAHAQAEREVLEHARSGRLKMLAEQKGVTQFEYAESTLRGALLATLRDAAAGQLYSVDITSLAALLIELLRECHLKHYNQKPPGQA